MTILTDIVLSLPVLGVLVALIGIAFSPWVDKKKCGAELEKNMKLSEYNYKHALHEKAKKCIYNLKRYAEHTVSYYGYIWTPADSNKTNDTPFNKKLKKDCPMLEKKYRKSVDDLECHILTNPHCFSKETTNIYKSISTHLRHDIFQGDSGQQYDVCSKLLVQLQNLLDAINCKS